MTTWRCQWSGTAAIEAVDVLVVEQLLIAARHRQVRAHDLAGEHMASVVQVAGGHAFDVRQVDGGAE